MKKLLSLLTVPVLLGTNLCADEREQNERRDRPARGANIDWDSVKKRIEGAVERGDMTREQANDKYRELKERAGGPRNQERRRPVQERAQRRGGDPLEQILGQLVRENKINPGDAQRIRQAANRRGAGPRREHDGDQNERREQVERMERTADEMHEVLEQARRELEEIREAREHLFAEMEEREHHEEEHRQHQEREEERRHHEAEREQAMRQVLEERKKIESVRRQAEMRARELMEQRKKLAAQHRELEKKREKTEKQRKEKKEKRDKKGDDKE